MKKPISVRKRFFKIASVAIRIVFDFRKEQILIKRRGYAYSQQRMKHIHEKRARQLYDTAVSLEGAVIKICQYFSARPEVFPKPYIEILSELQDQVPPVSFDKIEAVLEEAYGDYHQYFQSVDRRSLASASLAQTHKAILKNGQEVVLKVLKPGIENIIDTDCAIFYYVVKLISAIGFLQKRNDFIEALSNLMDDFFVVTGDELDFRREVYISTLFRKQFKKYDYIDIPYIHHKYSTENIIVMSFIRGDKIYDISDWKRQNNSPKLVSRRLIEVYLHQVLFSRLVHFDPHPGNLLVMENSRFALLDFGMTGEITREMKKGMWLLLTAFFITKDFRQMVDTLDDLGFIRKGFNKYTLLPVIEFAHKVIMEIDTINRESIYKIDFSPVRDNLLDIAAAKAFNLPPNWAYLGKTISTLFGVVFSLNPGFDIKSEIRYALFRMLKNNGPRLATEVSDMIVGEVTENVFSLLRLPKKADTFIDHLERGDTRLKTDQENMNKEINGLKEFVVRFSFFLLGILSAMGAYLLHVKGEAPSSLVFLILSGLFSIVALVYRKRTLEDEIREEIGKMI